MESNSNINEMDRELQEVLDPTGEEQTPAEAAAEVLEETEISAEPSREEPRRSEVQERFNELTRDKHEWRRLAERLMDERYSQTAPEPGPAPEIPDSFSDLPKPRYDDYDDPAEHAEAVGRWGTKVELRRYELAQQQRLQEMQAAHQQQQLEQWAQEGLAKYSDFIDVVSKSPQEGGPFITPEMGIALQGEKNSHEIAYYLGQNPQESRQIGQLDPIQQVREIGKLAYKLENQVPPARVDSRAPASTAPVKGKDTLARKLEDMTPAEFIAHRNAEEYGGSK